VRAVLRCGAVLSDAPSSTAAKEWLSQTPAQLITGHHDAKQHQVCTCCTCTACARVSVGRKATPLNIGTSDPSDAATASVCWPRLSHAALLD
jgi:hypothetical protein